MTKNEQGRKSENLTNANSNHNINSQVVQPSVFQETRQPWEIAIERMSAQMEKMMTHIFSKLFKIQLQLQHTLFVILTRLTLS